MSQFREPQARANLERTLALVSSGFLLSCGLGYPSKEADECCSDAEGHWFAFNMSLTSIILMERKGMPSHLQSLPCVDNPNPLSTVIHELEDAGEALQISSNWGRKTGLHPIIAYCYDIGYMAIQNAVVCSIFSY